MGSSVFMGMLDPSQTSCRFSHRFVTCCIIILQIRQKGNQTFITNRKNLTNPLPFEADACCLPPGTSYTKQSTKGTRSEGRKSGYDSQCAR